MNTMLGCYELHWRLSPSVSSFVKKSTFCEHSTHHLPLYLTENLGWDLAIDFSFLVIFLSSYFGSCGRLSWLNCQLLSAR